MNSIIVDKPLKNEKVNKKYDGDSLKVGLYCTGNSSGFQSPVLHLRSVTNCGMKPSKLLCHLQTKPMAFH